MTAAGSDRQQGGKPFGPEDLRWDADRVVLRQWLAQELNGHYQPRLAEACEHIASWARQEPSAV